MMKKILRITVFMILTAALCFLITGCKNKELENDPWESAAYTEDTEFGTGGKTVEVEVISGENSVTFTLKTDKDNLGDALMEYELISGEKGPYGIYVKAVNGIRADYDEDKAYWSLSKNGEILQTGVSDTKISDGECYELTYTK